MITEVEISKRAQKQLKKMPVRIAKSLQLWVHAVAAVGLDEIRRIPGYHDEPLKGNRKGQRSIRLSRSYRTIYIVKTHDKGEFVFISEVNRHVY